MNHCLLTKTIHLIPGVSEAQVLMSQSQKEFSERPSGRQRVSLLVQDACERYSLCPKTGGLYFYKQKKSGEGKKTASFPHVVGSRQDLHH